VTPDQLIAVDPAMARFAVDQEAIAGPHHGEVVVDLGRGRDDLLLELLADHAGDRLEEIVDRVHPIEPLAVLGAGLDHPRLGVKRGPHRSGVALRQGGEHGPNHADRCLAVSGLSGKRGGAESDPSNPGNDGEKTHGKILDEVSDPEPLPLLLRSYLPYDERRLSPG